MMQSCAIYLSTGAAAVAAQIASHAARSPCVAVVDTFCDQSYKRSSVKIVGHAAHLLDAAVSAASFALDAIDLTTQPYPAPHPRCGAVDLVSFMPLSDQSATSIADDLKICDMLAWSLGQSLGSIGCPVLMFGAGACRSLRETRRATSFFSSINPTLPPDVFSTLPSDFGPQRIRQTSGISIVGSQPYVTNFNITVSGASLAVCKSAASLLRAEMRVQVMALPHEHGTVEIGCNLQATECSPCPPIDRILQFVARSLPSDAVVERSYVVGLAPSQALQIAKDALHEV